MINYLFIIIAGILLGTIGIFVKFIGGSIDPMVLNFYRVFFAFLTVLIFVPFIDKNTFKIKKTDLTRYVLIGLIFAISFSLTNLAYLYAPVQNVSLILGFFPFSVLIFAYFLLKEKITKTKIVTLILAIIGLAIINPLSPEGFIGNILALICAAIDGALIALLRREEKSHSIGGTVWFFFFATLFLLPFPIIKGFGTISLPLISLGVISTGAVYLVYSLGLERVEAEIASIIVMIACPLTAIILAASIIQETLEPRIIIGGAVLLFAGIYLQTHLKKHKKKILKNTRGKK